MTRQTHRTDLDAGTMAWRKLERQLAEPETFDRLMEQEQEMESGSFKSSVSSPQQSGSDKSQVQWVQRALNRASSFGIAENGIPSVQTRRALQKFQVEQGLRPTGNMTPRTRTALVKLSGMPAPRSLNVGDWDDWEAELEGLSGRCPVDNAYVIRGFGQYSDEIRLLPPEQQNKIAAVANEIVSSQSGAPGLAPVTEVTIVGHADPDVARERKEPGFVQSMSEKRALAGFESLSCKVFNSPRHPDVRWVVTGRGSRDLVVPNPGSESEAKCNRRVEFILGRSAHPSPRLEPGQTDSVSIDHQFFLEYYHIALQGTSGKYDSSEAAENAAREIAHRTLGFIAQRFRVKNSVTPGCERAEDFKAYFKDALQGTASKFDNPDLVISRAAEIAERTQIGLLQEVRRLEWQYATLPQPMGPDCEIVRGMVSGPANHTLCGVHGHILDVAAHTVISHDLDEYKKQFRR